jgi:ElaB/YqjD/DUF883 family membrane-anchored ribosome-binding protein
MNEDLINNLNAKLESAIQKGKNFVEEEELQARLEEVKAEAEDQIRKHPIRSVAIGFAVGFIFAKLFSNND